MVNLCYLCNRKASADDNISLHRFPKNIEIRAKWLNACRLSPNDDVTRTRICCRHFKAEDLCQSNIFGNVKSSIKRNAVPTLYLTNPLNIDERPLSKTPMSKPNETEAIANESSSDTSDNDNDNLLDTVEKRPEDFVELCSNVVQKSYKSSTNTHVVESREKSTVSKKNGQCRKRKFLAA